MMEDRELLELAAKAAGISPASFYGRNVGWYDSRRGTTGSWDPLKNDGDALRLAVSLDIHVKRHAGSTTAQEWASCLSFTEHDHWSINKDDEMKSTRRAIVRAAAGIGKAMP